MHVAESASTIDLHTYCTSTPVTGTHHVDLDEARASDLHAPQHMCQEKHASKPQDREGGRERLSEGEGACVLEGWVTL